MLEQRGTMVALGWTVVSDYLPTILSDVDVQMEAVKSEIFGPVLTVQLFDDEEEALALADHPDYRLAAGVHTADIGRALRMARSIEAGAVWINRYGRTSDITAATSARASQGPGTSGLRGRPASEKRPHRFRAGRVK